MRIGSTTTLTLLALALAVSTPSGSDAARRRRDTPPNILLVIMDDVGIDQMKSFGYGGGTAPSMPSIDRLAERGVRFHNTWAMPACSTSRAVLFEGRYPLRTNVYAALGPNDLANSQVSPFEMTVPKVLADAGYESALFGKFHLGLQNNNPAELTMPHALGWDYFHGFLDETGDPASIDTTAGGVAGEGTWGCGFVADADSGACYQPSGECEELSKQGSLPPGRICRDRGGILDPGASCQDELPATLDFDELSAHFVSPLVINYPDGSYEAVPANDPRARRFRASASVDAAIDWIRDRSDDRPWMATVSFSSAHTPLMQPPVDEARANDLQGSDLDCTDAVDQRTLMNLMVESIDDEVGRLLVETGIAKRTKKGRLVYRPKRSDTMIVVVGDNGSLGSTVKLPFDATRSKGTAYQTGVWVPLIVSGPLVRRPNRAVSSMTNIADVYQLFGEMAGLDVHALAPRPVDAQSLLPYLENPKQASIRTSNFTQVGPNLQANGGINGPCHMADSCSHIPVTKGVCEDNNGIWWGVGADDPETAGPEGLEYCCQVNAYLDAQGAELLTLQPNYSTGIRNDRYKIVQNTTLEYTGSQEDPCEWNTVTEFYEIDEAVPAPNLDMDGDDLLLGTLTPEQQENFDALSAELSALLESSPTCTGDGNADGVVDATDVGLWSHYAETWGASSVYDVNLDGVTDDDDQTLITENAGVCPAASTLTSPDTGGNLDRP